MEAPTFLDGHQQGYIQGYQDGSETANGLIFAAFFFGGFVGVALTWLALWLS